MSKDLNKLKELMRQNTVTEDYICQNKLEKDFCLSVNEVSDILGYAVPTVQNFVLPYLKQAEATPGGYIKEYMFEKTKNKRIKKVISKESFVNYIGAICNVEEEYETIYLDKKNDFFDDILEHVKLKRNIQVALNRASNELNKMYGTDNEVMERKRIDFRQEMVSNIFIESHFGKLEEIKRFYQERNSRNVAMRAEYTVNDFYEVLKNNMYSVRQLKEKYSMKHYQQVYRVIDRVSCMKIKLASAIDGTEITNEINDRNIRYIFKDDENLVFSTEYYYIRLNKDVYDVFKILREESNDTETMEDFIKKKVEEVIKTMEFEDLKKE